MASDIRSAPPLASDEIIERCLNGDQAAWETIVRLYWRKVFNVAASRARDQLWLVHSLDPGRDLKPGDLRLRLIQHVEAAGARKPAEIDLASFLFESELHSELCRTLDAEGYRVTPRYETPTIVCLLVLLALVVLSFSVLERRVRGVEVVK